MSRLPTHERRGRVDITDRMTGPAVVVVGSVNADQVFEVEELPRPGETVVAGHERTSAGGKGANQAAVAAALSDGVTLVATVGDDERGTAALAQLRREGVNVNYVRSVNADTGVATVLIDRHGENIIVLRPGANELLSPSDVGNAVRETATQHTVVLASCEIPIDAVFAAATAARHTGARFVLNPAPARHLPAKLIELCDVIVPNEVEAAQLAADGVSLFHSGVDVVVTRGARGAEVHTADGRLVEIPSPTVSVQDTTGAGDAFAATLAIALQAGLAIADAAVAAVAAGAIAVTSKGARDGSLTRSAILGLLDDDGQHVPARLRAWLQS